MAILETAIVLENKWLIVHRYYDSAEDVKFIESRTFMINTIRQIAEKAFGDELVSFSTGEFRTLLTSLKLENYEKHLLMYCIVDNNTIKKDVIKKMNKILNQFVNRYSEFDIMNHTESDKIEKFEQFEKRITKIFGDCIFTKDDRFKSMFG